MSVYVCLVTYTPCLLTVYYSALPVASLSGPRCLWSREDNMPCMYDEGLIRAGAKYVCEGSCIANSFYCLWYFLIIVNTRFTLQHWGMEYNVL